MIARLMMKQRHRCRNWGIVTKPVTCCLFWYCLVFLSKLMTSYKHYRGNHLRLIYNLRVDHRVTDPDVPHRQIGHNPINARNFISGILTQPSGILTQPLTFDKKSQPVSKGIKIPTMPAEESNQPVSKGIKIPTMPAEESNQPVSKGIKIPTMPAEERNQPVSKGIKIPTMPAEESNQPVSKGIKIPTMPAEESNQPVSKGIKIPTMPAEESNQPVSKGIKIPTMPAEESNQPVSKGIKIPTMPAEESNQPVSKGIKIPTMPAEESNQPVSKGIKIPTMPAEESNQPVSKGIKIPTMPAEESNQPVSKGIKIPTMPAEERNQKFQATPPNPLFIFHNKLPKSGSSTMNNILKILRKKNNFTFMKVEPGETTFYDRRPLVDYLRDKIQPPFFLLKHHYWINFTQFDMKQPTYINIIRDPIEWFTSRYYFARYGWKRKPGCRTNDCGMTKEEFEMDIDECVATQHRSCTTPWMYLPFFCGATKNCMDVSSEESKKKALETAKSRIRNDYYFLGILEEFEDSLRALELILPHYFQGALRVWKGNLVQRVREVTRTNNKKKMSRESEVFFRSGPLKYEVELYEFARHLFKQRLIALNLTSSESNKT